jgi:RNA polymerase sigma factor (sigma-70 family)
VSPQPAIDGTDETDRSLLQQDDEAALLARHHDDLRQRTRLLLHREGRVDDAEDVLQMVLLRLLREIRGARRFPGGFRATAHRYVAWEVRRFLRSVPPDGEPLEDGHGGGADPTEDVRVRLTLDEALDALPPRARQIGRLRFVRGLEIAQIAAGLGTTRNAVDQALHRVRAHLQKEWLDDR